jgi:NTP pyrophosphatase (non-canonical NTP hydrolase)
MGEMSGQEAKALASEVSVIKLDMLQMSFNLQRSLQILIYGEEAVESRWPLVLEASLVSQIQGLIVEAAEAMKTLRYRPEWDKHSTDFDKAREEIIDVYHYVINAARLLWPDAASFFHSYLVKNEKNFERASSRRSPSIPSSDVKAR